MPKINLKPPFRITQGTLIQPLTDTEGRLVWTFMCRNGIHGITADQLAESIWGEGWNWPETYAKSIHVKIWALRKKLEPFGWTITHVPPGAHNPMTGTRRLERI